MVVRCCINFFNILRTTVSGRSFPVYRLVLDYARMSIKNITYESMRACVCVCVCVCMHACMYVCMYVCMPEKRTEKCVMRNLPKKKKDKFYL
jgi:hypothetical protein